MGKYKGNKPKVRNNPVGLPSMKETLLREMESVDGTEDAGFVPNLIEQLKSHVVEERDSALNSLSLACQNPRLLEELLEADIVSIASSLLIDNSSMVRHSAAGSLRNLSMGGPVVCELMVAQDVITPLAALLKKHYAVDWQPKKKDGKIDTVTETFIEAVNLLWNLCESSDVALKRFNKEGLAEIVMKGLNTETYGVRVAISVAQLFHAVTEENAELVSAAEALASVFERILSTDMGNDIESKYLQSLGVGVLLNIKGGSISRIAPSSLSAFANILTYSLKLNHLEAIKELVGSEDFRKSDERNGRHEEPSSGNGEEGMETSVSVEDQVQSITNILNAQILSMTIFSNLLCAGDDDDENVSDDESGESVTDFNCELDGASMETDENWTSALAAEVQEIIVNHDLKRILKDKLGQLDGESIEMLKTNARGSKILKLAIQLQSTAFLCFQNLLDSLEISELGGVEETEALFAAATSVLHVEASGDMSQEAKLSLIEAITSFQRAIVQKWADGKVLRPMAWFKPDILNVFVEVYQKSTEAKIHTNIIKIIGSFGILLSRIQRLPENEETVKNILGQVGLFLLQCVGEPLERDRLPVAAETLDTIFDVFAEDDYNDVLNELRLIEKLKKFAPAYKKLVQSQRRQLAEHRAIIQTSKTNLSRFISYKQQQGCV